MILLLMILLLSLLSIFLYYLNRIDEKKKTSEEEDEELHLELTKEWFNVCLLFLPGNEVGECSQVISYHLMRSIQWNTGEGIGAVPVRVFFALYPISFLCCSFSLSPIRLIKTFL